MKGEREALFKYASDNPNESQKVEITQRKRGRNLCLYARYFLLL